MRKKEDHKLFMGKRFFFIIKSLSIILSLGFGLYVIYSPHSVSEKKFWTLGYPKLATQDHDFPNLFFHTKKEVSAYLYKNYNSRAMIEEFLIFALSHFHCVHPVTKNCDEFRFHEMKKKYYFYVNLEMTEDEIKKHNINLNAIEHRINKMFLIYVAMKIPKLPPKLIFIYEENSADVIFNISLNKNIAINSKAKSDHCTIQKTIESNVLTRATISFLNTNFGQDKYFGYCESKIPMNFYDIFALTVARKDLPEKDDAIYLGIATEYYRWLAINGKSPKNKNELTRSVNDYLDFIYIQF